MFFFMLDTRFKTLNYMFSLIGHEQGKAIVEKISMVDFIEIDVNFKKELEEFEGTFERDKLMEL